jgi:hypothetical protein
VRRRVSWAGSSSSSKAKRRREEAIFFHASDGEKLSLDGRYGGSLDAMLATPMLQLGEERLAQKGIGPETADSILLNAGHHPIFDFCCGFLHEARA